MEIKECWCGHKEFALYKNYDWVMECANCDRVFQKESFEKVIEQWNKPKEIVLKNCMLCNSDDVKAELHEARWFIHCNDCAFTVVCGVNHLNKDNAIKLWNRIEVNGNE